MKNWKRDFRSKSKMKNHKKDVYKFLFRFFDIGKIPDSDKMDAKTLLRELTVATTGKGYRGEKGVGSTVCRGWPGYAYRMYFINIARGLSFKPNSRPVNLDTPGWKKPEGQVLSMTNHQRHKHFQKNSKRKQKLIQKGRWAA